MAVTGHGMTEVHNSHPFKYEWAVAACRWSSKVNVALYEAKCDANETMGETRATFKRPMHASVLHAF